MAGATSCLCREALGGRNDERANPKARPFDFTQN
jgi:hypothetical protein